MPLVPTPDEMMSAVTDSMAERTGRTLEEWVALVAASGVDPLDQNAVRRWLREVHGVKQNSQWAIADAAAQEAGWVRFILEGPEAIATPTDAAGFQKWADEFKMLPGETLEGLLAEYEDIAARTDELVRTIPDLDASHPLPVAPWFPPDATRSARRVFMHIVAETAQHSGHADILRESIDGQKTMG